MAPDDEDDGDLYDDEFDFVDDEDDDLSDLDDDDDSAVDDEGDDSELDHSADRRDDAADAEPVDQPARRPAAPKRGRGGETRAADDQRDLFDREDGQRGQRRDDRHRSADGDADAEVAEAEAPEDLGPPPPPANYRVHVYEYQEFKRTIDRPFTAEDAEAFASEFNRTSKPYSRFAVAGKDDAKPKKTLD